ncbi:hypothetical protein [Arsenicicoccus bolidensis]|uniref:hypothetical protein n=1 Tax=Arsenicicoccus bolidensis TaxID=229480 RepID=UPI0028AFCF35|nr:hypothetical protein [Arsenicicoccus bolidensis]
MTPTPTQAVSELKAPTDGITGTTITYGALGYPYAGTFWTERVDILRDDAVDPNSAAMVAWLDGKVKNAPQAKEWWINSNTYNGKTVRATATTPRVPVAFGSDCGGRTEPGNWKSWASNVPVDPSWIGSNGTDSSLVIIDEQKRQAYSFWVFRREGGAVTSCHGGRMNLTNDPAQAEGETPGVFPNQGGATASSLPHDAGSISRDDVTYAQQHGYFPHALYVGLPDAKAGVWSCPATRTDGADNAPAAIMEGQRLRMKMTEQEINALPTTWQQWIARTGVIHGYMPGDKTYDTAIFSTIQDEAFWTSFAASQPGGLSIKDVPFATKLQVLKPNTACTNAPANRVAGGSF